MRSCAILTGPLYIFIASRRTFELSIALDRFSAVFFPMRYKAWDMNQKWHKVLIAFGFFVGHVMASLTFVDVYDGVQLLYCSSRNSMSILLQLTHIPYVMATGVVTIVLYLISLMFAKACVRVTI